MWFTSKEKLGLGAENRGFLFRLGKLFSATLTVMLMGSPAFAEQCPDCRAKVHTKDIGSCKLCGESTESGQFQLCMACSSKLRECEWCRKPLAKPAAAPQKIRDGEDGTYKIGRWEYRYTVSNKGSRSEGYYGELLWDGKAMVEPSINDYIQTPWGPIYWVGQPTVPFGAHGWMLRSLPSRPTGKLLPDPAQAQKLCVRMMVLGEHRGSQVKEGWVREELKKLNALESVGVHRDWFELGPTSITLHDSKHYGQLKLRLADGSEGPFRVEFSDSPHYALVELPRQAGTRRVMPYTMQSSVASMDLYLVFEVMNSDLQPKP